MRYRVITIPQRGVPNNMYKVEGLSITVHPWWEFKKPSEEWCTLNEYGSIHRVSIYYTSIPRLNTFGSKDIAKKWIKTELEYQAKKSKVVYESE